LRGCSPNSVERPSEKGATNVRTLYWPVYDYDYGRPFDWDTSAPVDVLEQTASAGESGLSYDAATDEYTYVL
jgi:hypothetical protein